MTGSPGSIAAALCLALAMFSVSCADTKSASEHVQNPVQAAALPPDVQPVAMTPQRPLLAEPVPVRTVPDIPEDSEDSPWFSLANVENWFDRIFRRADRTSLVKVFEDRGWAVPDNSYALIAPIRVEGGRVQMAYYSFGSTAFDYSMTLDGEEMYWPASTVKLTAAVLALVKLNEYGLDSQTVVRFTDIEGYFEGNVVDLCRSAIIPSDNTAYNRLMEIAGFDETNDDYLPKKFCYPAMILQRRYVRNTPDDSLRVSPAIDYENGGRKGTIPYRKSAGRVRHLCPRESNCTTLAELAETAFRVMYHEYLPEDYRFPIQDGDIGMLRQAMFEAPSCIGKGVAEVMGTGVLIYNKGGKVIGDDRLEVGVISAPDGGEQYLIALSMPYYEGVEEETNRLAKRLVLAMRALEKER